MSQKEKVSQVIARELLTMIENGEFPPGSKLPTEMELTAKFGVSRVPIREALSMLRAAGVINSRQGGGSYVEESTNSTLLQRIHIETDSIDNIKHLFELRRVLEPEAAYLAAQRRTPEQLENMKRILNEWQKKSSENTTTARKEDIEFHSSIILATQNPIMIQTQNNLASLYDEILSITLLPNTELIQKRESVYKEHLDILLAIEAEEPELAKTLCQIHLRNAEEKISLFIKDYTL